MCIRSKHINLNILLYFYILSQNDFFYLTNYNNIEVKFYLILVGFDVKTELKMDHMDSNKVVYKVEGGGNQNYTLKLM